MLVATSSLSCRLVMFCIHLEGTERRDRGSQVFLRPDGCFFEVGRQTWLGLGRDSDRGDIDRTGGKKKKKTKHQGQGASLSPTRVCNGVVSVCECVCLERLYTLQRNGAPIQDRRPFYRTVSIYTRLFWRFVWISECIYHRF